MALKVQVTLSDSIYDRVQKLANRRQQGIGETIANYLEENLPTLVDDTAVDNTTLRERQAFLDMHPQLLEKYAGQYVAIYHGKLVDHDSDKIALYERIEQKYPDQFVLMRLVEQDPERVITIRSPCFIDIP